MSLHCKHSYCKDCIEELVEFEEGDEASIKCVECRSKTILAKGETVSSLKRESTLEFLLKRLDVLALTNDRTHEISEDSLLTCCPKPKSWYCWGCKYYFCNSCVDHPGTPATKCKSMLPLFVKYSRRFQSYVPYCPTHNAFHTSACMRCADTFCRYCGVVEHKGHDNDLTTFMQYTKCFKKPIDLIIRSLHSFIKKQKDILEQTKIKNYNIQREKERIDKFLQQKKIILLSQVLLMFDVVETPILKYCEELNITFEEVKKDIEIAVDNDLFHAILDAYDDVRIANFDHIKSIIRSASMLSEKVNLNPLLFPNLINYSEAEKYVFEALEKVNQYTKNKMVCKLAQCSTLDDDDIEHVSKFKHEKMMIVLSTLFALELCEKKIIKKFYNAWKEFKVRVTQFKEKINEFLLTTNNLLEQFEKLSQGNAIDLISRSKDLITEYQEIHPQLYKTSRFPDFDVRIEAEQAPVERIYDLLDCKHHSAILESFCTSLQLNFVSVLELIPESVCDESERDKLVYLFGNREDCDGAEKYVHFRLKDIGLHNSNIPDFDICKKDVITLVEKGFPLNASINAVYFTNNKGAETAMKWIFHNSKDPEFDNPIILDYPLQNDSTISNPSEDTNQLRSFFAAIYFRSYTFSVKDARIALSATEDADDWIHEKRISCRFFERAGFATTDDDQLSSVSSFKADSNNNDNGEHDMSGSSVESGIISKKKSYRKRKLNWSRKGHECADGIITLMFLSEKMIKKKTIKDA